MKITKTLVAIAFMAVTIPQTSVMAHCGCHHVYRHYRIHYVPVVVHDTELTKAHVDNKFQQLDNDVKAVGSQVTLTSQAEKQGMSLQTTMIIILGCLILFGLLLAALS